jgi:hypothetical protein
VSSGKGGVFFGSGSRASVRALGAAREPGANTGGDGSGRRCAGAAILRQVPYARRKMGLS